MIVSVFIHKISVFFPIHRTVIIIINIIIIIIIKRGARLRESDMHPISPKTPAPQYQPLDRKKRKGKIVETTVA